MNSEPTRSPARRFGSSAAIARESSTLSGCWRRVKAKVAFGTDCGMFPFSHGIREFQAMVAAGLTPVRALKAGTAVAAELLGREDIGVLKPGECADIVAMPGNPIEDIAATAHVDFVMRAGLVHRRPGDERTLPPPAEPQVSAAQA